MYMDFPKWWDLHETWCLDEQIHFMSFSLGHQKLLKFLFSTEVYQMLDLHVN